MKNPSQSRRNFLGNLLAVAGTGALPFSLNLAAMGTAAAQNAGDYKAIVCVFLNGGNDGFNTLLPTDSASWSEYLRLRTTTEVGSIALPSVGAAGGVLPISPLTAQAGRSFALHPSLAPLKTLFGAGRAAIVANVGTLVQPTTKAQYLAGTARLPPKLFSHNDQQAVWQSLQPENSIASGWGGRMGELMAASNSNATFTCISNAGNALFLSGRKLRQFQISGTSMPPINSLNTAIFGAQLSSTDLGAIISGDHADPFQKEMAATVRSAVSNQAMLAAAIGAGGSVPNPPPYVNPNGTVVANPLAVQLQTVARLIAGRSTLGARRQVFFVSLNGFDTHDFQRVKHADLLAKLAHAMAYFDSTMASLSGTDMRKQVTLFTASDFGRTFSSNGDGTDHGWGSHHFVMGGAVKGGDIYGTVPPSGLGHAWDVGSGSLLPTSSVDQYGATLASWFGLSATQIADVFPNIVNFSNRNLGFMT